MAAPQKRRQAEPSAPLHARPPMRKYKRRAKAGASRKGYLKRRGFAVVVVVPALLMLGSVYAHGVSVSLAGEAAVLEERLVRAETAAEELEVRLTELSAPGRIRALASEDLNMRDPNGENMTVYGENEEDGIQNGREKPEEGSR